jgi:hypothetical protein
MAWLMGARFDLMMQQLKGGAVEMYDMVAGKQKQSLNDTIISSAKGITASIADTTASIKKEL